MCSERRKRSGTHPLCSATSAVTVLLTLPLPQRHALTKCGASSVFYSCVLHSSVSSWRCESPSSPRRLFHLGSALGGCRHTSELAKANTAWACTGMSHTVSSSAPGRQGLPPLGLRRGKRQSLQEGWEPAGWWGALLLQHTEVTTTIKKQKSWANSSDHWPRCQYSCCCHLKVQSLIFCWMQTPRLTR